MIDIKKEQGTHIKSTNKTKKIMMHLFIALMPLILFSFYKNGILPYQNGYISVLEMLRPILMILVASLTCVVSEIVYFKFIDKKDNIKELIKESYSIFPGLFLALTLPLYTPFSILIVGSIIATIVGKMIFGGFGNNIFNPALIGRLFVMSAYGVVIINNGGYFNLQEVDTISTATPLANAFIQDGIGSYETLVKPFGSLFNFFVGTVPGSLGETSALFAIIGFIYLAINKVIKVTIPLSYVATVFVMTYLIGSYNNLGLWFPLFHILSGGLMFGAIFMATDPVTSPTTGIGQVLYGIMLGILTVVFRFLTPEPEGVLTSILTMNMFVFLLDKTGAKSRLKFKKAVIPFLVSWIMIVGIGFYIANSYQVVVTKDPNFEIVDKIIANNEVKYIATQKGYVGLIKAEVIIKDGIITKFEVIEQSESFYQRIIDADYANKLVSEQANLKDVDTVSNATVTSRAMKTLLINVMEDYYEE
jgi:Na+-translocating ferredoxin:NAD+ oxidoreductase subunit D